MSDKPALFWGCYCEQCLGGIEPRRASAPVPQKWLDAEAINQIIIAEARANADVLAFLEGHTDHPAALWWGICEEGAFADAILDARFAFPESEARP